MDRLLTREEIALTEFQAARAARTREAVQVCDDLIRIRRICGELSPLDELRLHQFLADACGYRIHLIRESVDAAAALLGWKAST